jgi:flagellar biosynthesis protein FliP
MIMQPVLGDVYTNAFQPVEKGQITAQQGWEKAAVPFKAFLLRVCPGARTSSCSWRSLIAAARDTQRSGAGGARAGVYVIGIEGCISNRSGAVSSVLIIDLVVASVTLSVGMMQLPPVMVSAPFKILLFVLVDGWNLVVGSLVKSFY